MSTYPIILVDQEGTEIRLTQERWSHILEHAEMSDQLEKIRETVASPEIIVATLVDEQVHVYHRFYQATPVTSKWLLVTVKVLSDDAFVLTAFFSTRQKKGPVIWQA